MEYEYSNVMEIKEAQKLEEDPLTHMMVDIIKRIDKLNDSVSGIRSSEPVEPAEDIPPAEEVPPEEKLLPPAEEVPEIEEPTTDDIPTTEDM
jgi:hypothetical protein